MDIAKKTYRIEVQRCLQKFKLYSLWMPAGWTPTSARDWLTAHGFKPLKKVHKKGRELRYRIRSPAKYRNLLRRNLPGDIHFWSLGWRSIFKPGCVFLDLSMQQEWHKFIPLDLFAIIQDP